MTEYSTFMLATGTDVFQVIKQLNPTSNCSPPFGYMMVITGSAAMVNTESLVSEGEPSISLTRTRQEEEGVAGTAQA